MAPYDALNDNELTVLLKEGDHRAFTAIYDRYFWLLHSHAYKWTRNRNDTKDIIHELFLTVWQKRATLKLENRLKPYLYAAVRNRIINQLSRKRYTVTYSDSLDQFIKTGECLTDQGLRIRLLTEIIENAIAGMPPKMREVFELSRKSQLSNMEIAERLEISEETVRKHIHHALKLLRPKLQVILIICINNLF